MLTTLGAPSFVRLLHKGWESTTLSPTVNTLTENALVVVAATSVAAALVPTTTWASTALASTAGLGMAFSAHFVAILIPPSLRPATTLLRAAIVCAPANLLRPTVEVATSYAW